MPRIRNRIWPLLLACWFIGCRPSTPVSELPRVGPTLDDVGRRLGATTSASRLTEMAARGPALLAALNSQERDVLARGYLRFRSKMPIVVDVAVPIDATPFWIDDQGFANTGTTLRNPDAHWAVFRRSFPAGWVGLGVNGLDRRAPAHYVVFLRSPPGDPALTEDSIELDASSGSDWACVRATAEISAASEVHRPFDGIPAEYLGALLLQPRHDQRHATLLSPGRVWKTHVPSQVLPDQVAISFGADPSSQLAWNWRTAPEVEGTTVRLIAARYEAVDYDALGSPDLSRMLRIEGTSSIVRTPGLLNDPVNRRHVAVATGLSPDTTYLYSVGDGRPGAWGPWRAIKTAKRRGRTEFLFMGDVQTGMEDWGKRLVAAYRRHPGAEFLLLAGDLVDRGNERTNWDHFFLRAGEVFDRIPVMPCAGNHEYLDQGPRLYQSFFALPANGPAGFEPGLVYSFECGGAFFAILDSTQAVSSARLARRQAEWLDEALTNTRARWKLVMFHHPVYPSHPWRETPFLRESWVPVFDKHHVDLVLQGHDHAYQRTYPLRGHRPVEAAAGGTTYVVAVAGDKFCDQRTSEYAEVGFTRVSTYQTIEIDDVADRLTYRAWNDAGEVADRLVISRSNGRPSELAGREPADPRR